MPLEKKVDSVESQSCRDFPLFSTLQIDSDRIFDEFLIADVIINESYIYSAKLSEHATDDRVTRIDNIFNESPMLSVQFVITDRPAIGDADSQVDEVEIPYTKYRSFFSEANRAPLDGTTRALQDFDIGGDFAEGFIVRKEEKKLIVSRVRPSRRIEKTISLLKKWYENKERIVVKTFLEKGETDDIYFIEQMNWVYGPQDGSTCTFSVNLKKPKRFFFEDVPFQNSRIDSLQRAKDNGRASKRTPNSAQAAAAAEKNPTQRANAASAD
jgi:hypothetical protein